MRTGTRTRGGTIDAYLAKVPEDKKAALQKLRKTIHAAFPRAQECISYGIPAFRQDGRVIIWFGAARNHCSLYPGGVAEEFADELAGYETSKGTIRFTPEKPIPASLVRRLVKARIAREAARKPLMKTTAKAAGARRRR